MSVLAASVLKGRYIKVSSTSTDDDADIERTVDAADRLICGRLGMPETDTGIRTLAAADYDLYLHSPRVNRRRLWLPLPEQGAGTIDSVQLVTGAVADADTIGSDDYDLRGRVLYRHNGKWPAVDGPVLRVQLSSWGFASLAIDHPLGQAVALLTQHLWTAPKTQGFANKTSGGKSKQAPPNDDAIWQRIDTLIGGYQVAL